MRESTETVDHLVIVIIPLGMLISYVHKCMVIQWLYSGNLGVKPSSRGHRIIQSTLDAAKRNALRVLASLRHTHPTIPCCKAVIPWDTLHKLSEASRHF